ncbi:MAG TPA: glycosyltransferase [Gemmataceae bacterium]|nr:glycosyltransferase [Gemmataceae bacterium]
MPTVSVLVPNYNHARFLDERLKSIFNQAYQDFEVIFLDDASIDNSVEVFRKYSTRSNVRAILNERNSGSTFRQWNRGVRAAKGRYIWIAESDDVAEPQFLNTLVPLLESNSNIGIAYCNSTVIDERGEKQETVDRWSAQVDANRWSQDYINSGAEECRRYLIWRNTIPNASAVVFRKSIYEESGYADETMTRCGDWWVWVQMLLLSDIAYVAAPLNLFRRHMAISHSIINHNIAMEETLQVLHEIASRLDLSPEAEAEMGRAFVYHLGWRQNVANEETVVLPSTILYLAALTSERLYSAILDFVRDHPNWEIDWSPLSSCVLAGFDKLRPSNYRTFCNLSTIVTKLEQQLSVLNTEHERLRSSRSYRVANKLNQLRGYFAPNQSPQYNLLLRLASLVRRIRTGGAAASRMWIAVRSARKRSSAA